MDIRKFTDVYDENIGVVHTSSVLHYIVHKIVPDSEEDILKLLRMYCHSNHQKIYCNAYIQIYDKAKKHNQVAYIDLGILKEDIRDKKIKKLLYV